MARFLLVTVILIVIGCDKNQNPASFTPDTKKGEIIATLDFDSCLFYPDPSRGVLDSLCSETSSLTITFESVQSDVIGETDLADLILRTRNIKTGSTTWECSDPGVASALVPMYSDSAVTLSAYRIIGDGNDSRGMSVSVHWAEGSVTYTMRLSGSSAIPIDTTGYPLIENSVTWSGRVGIQSSGSTNFEVVWGDADVTIRNIREVPVDTTH